MARKQVSGIKPAPIPEDWKLVLQVGDVPSVADGVRIVDLTPASTASEDVLERLAAAGLDSADMRSEFGVAFAGIDSATALTVYSAVAGFAQGTPNIWVDGKVTKSAEMVAKVAKSADAGKPDPVRYQVQVSAEPHPSLETVLLSGRFTPKDVSLIRYAKRVRLVPSADPYVALLQLLGVAALRRRTEPSGRMVERFPWFCDGTEPAPTDDDRLTPVGIDLDTLRVEGSRLRRSIRLGDRSARVEAVEPSERLRRLAKAAALPIGEVLEVLGASQDPNTGLWHCPRPERHNHGDANASMRVYEDGTARCYSCDPARQDPLSLTVDVSGWGPDDAATWLLDTIIARSDSQLRTLFE